MHFHARQFAVKTRQVGPVRQQKVAATQAVDVYQQIAVERSSHAQRIVVGYLQLNSVFKQIDTNEQPTARRLGTDGMHLTQESKCLVGREITDARARIEKYLRPVSWGSNFSGQRQCV